MLIIGMEGSNTSITHPETKEVKPFSFDFSYWSHDGFKENADGELLATGDKYATQRKVYSDVGADCLNSAFEGYNSTLFAYGQTGQQAKCSHHVAPQLFRCPHCASHRRGVLCCPACRAVFSGSGKSYSMVGYGVNKGIIPICCEEMFKAVVKGVSESKKYQVAVTMLEIYNEVIRSETQSKCAQPIAHRTTLHSPR